MELDSYDTATGEHDQPSSFAQDDSEPTPHHAESGRSRGAINTWVGFLILAVVTSVVASVEMITIGSIG